MLVVVGRIGRPHGVRGAVTIEVRTDEPDSRFAPGSVLQCDSGARLCVSTSTWHSGRLLVTFDGYPDRTAVEQLRGQVLRVERSEGEHPEDPEEFYDTALVGCQVFDQDGSAIGVVADVVHLPAQDMLVLATPEERELLIPFVEAIVPTVDTAQGRIVIDPPPGLLEAAD
jgi:16S rRNA processing protein RimM